MSPTLIHIAVLPPAFSACLPATNYPNVEPSQSKPQRSKPQRSEPRQSNPIAVAKPGEIRVTITGFRNRKGQLLVSLFTSPKGFPDKGDLATRRSAHKIDGEQIEVRFKKVAAGTYAVAVLHDEDKNFRMKTGMFGIPKEGYGVSNNARSRFGPPKYGDAKFKVTGPYAELEIKLIYH